MGHAIDEIEGIGPTYCDKLASAEIKTTEDLLSLCCSPNGRKQVADTTGVTEKQLLKWANMADLMRISGVGPEYAELLEAAGVDTVKELRTRRADNLAARMAEVNATRKLTRNVPSDTVVSKWVEQANGLDPKISY